MMVFKSGLMFANPGKGRIEYELIYSQRGAKHRDRDRQRYLLY